MASEAKDGNAAQGGVPLTQLPLQQLEQFKNSVDEEIKLLADSSNQLKTIQQKFTDSLDALNKLSASYEGKEVMVPMTSSMYVPGVLRKVDTCLVDVGTGYYVEKTIPQAKENFKRKIEYLTTQLKKIQPALVEKQQIRQAIIETMQVKFQQQMASQGQSAVPSKS